MSENKSDSEIIVVTTQEAPRPLVSSEERAIKFRKELEALQNITPQQEEVISNEQERVDNTDNSSDNDRSDVIDPSEHIDESDTDAIEEAPVQSHSIPKKRFNQELQRRKEIESELQKEREARIRMETELNLFNKAAQALQNKKEEALEINPLDEEAHSYYVKQINNLKAEFETKLEQMNKVQTQSRFETTVNNQAESFKKKHEDFEDAYKFVVDTEIKNAQIMGLDENEAYDFAIAKLQPIAWNIYNKGGNVAESVYNMAKNYGYNAKGAKKGSNVDLNSINKNIKRSASVMDDVPAAITSMSDSYESVTSLKGFEKLKKDNGRGVDPNKFRKALENIGKRK